MKQLGRTVVRRQARVGSGKYGAWKCRKVLMPAARVRVHLNWQTRVGRHLERGRPGGARGRDPRGGCSSILVVSLPFWSVARARAANLQLSMSGGCARP